MKLKQKKYLAQAITLGLLLALPLGAQAEGTEYNKPFEANYFNDSETYNPYNIKLDGGKITFNEFQSGDKIILVSPGRTDDGGMAVYIKNKPKDYSLNGTYWDLGGLSYIASGSITNRNKDSYGIYAAVEDATVKMGDGIIITRSLLSESKGVYEKWGTINLGTMKICAENNFMANLTGNPYTVAWAMGVNIGNWAIASLGDASIIRASAEGERYDKAWAVSAEYYPQSVTLGKDIIINATCSAASGEATGIYVDSGIFNVGDNLKIIAKGEGDGSIWVRGINSEVNPYELYVNYYGIEEPTVTIGEKAKVVAINEATAERATTYIGDDGYGNSIDKPHVTSTSYAMYINSGDITLEKDARIYAEGKDDMDRDSNIAVRGIYINSVDNPLRDLDNVNVETIKAEVTLEENAIIKAKNTAKKGEVTGIYARNKVDVGNNSQIIVTAEGEHHDSIGVYTESRKFDDFLGGYITTTAEVNLTGTDITVINNSTDTSSYTAGIEATAESKVNMQGGSIAGRSADNQEFKAIVTYDLGEVNVKDAVVAGSLIADNQGIIKMEANGPDSYLIGTVTTDRGNRNGGSTTDLTFKNTTWYLTGDSNVTNLNLDGGVVSMVDNEKEMSYKDYDVKVVQRKDADIVYYYDIESETQTTKQIDKAVSGNAHKLSIDKALNGSGTFIMDLTYHDNNVKSYEEAKDSDFIYIHGGDNSEQRLVFKDNNSNLGAMASDDKLYFAQIKQNAATFGEGGASVTEGGKKYDTVTAINEKGIYDLEFYIDSEASAAQDGYNDWFITGKTKKANPNGDSPIHSYNAGFALWRDDDTLLKRLGELRFTNDEGGAWARVIGKKLEDKRSLGFNTHAKTVQVGYDRKDVQEDGSGTWRKGVALGHTWADTSFRSGKGKNNYTDLTLYATNIRKHDHYWDLVARIGYIDSEYDTAYGDHGEFDNWAGSLSAEYGRKKKINEDNWFVEPQAQLTYSYMWGDTYTTRNGAQVVQSNADSLVGRAGFVISKELESELKYPHRYYAKAFIMHEFLDGGDNNIYFGSDRLYGGSDFKDTWYVVGVGANVDMGNSCTFYFDAERNFKAHVKMPYRIEAGFRWEF